MSVKRINLLFKGLILFLGMCGLSLLLIVAPKTAVFLTNNLSFNIILGLLWLSSIPVFFILINLWLLSSNLLKESLFSIKNSQRLVYISYASLVESLIYAAALIIGLVMLKGNLPYFIVCLFFFCLGITLAVVASLLSYIFKLGNQLKKENDLTI